MNTYIDIFNKQNKDTLRNMHSKRQKIILEIHLQTKESEQEYTETNCTAILNGSTITDSMTLMTSCISIPHILTMKIIYLIKILHEMNKKKCINYPKTKQIPRTKAHIKWVYKEINTFLLNLF